ncbi:O-demethylpuromycin-O-methyltransferase [Proteus hauseri ATCC 700826]|uniref:O-demethylpuromycin-O-methyltransferase n=1 Tax=Proteus hauseri ATCC 700826 TaxID=1354271 RepID=A0AAJ3HRY2_PROHU|nr:methyltransferase [Proteus hauseri]OAT46484.1 O-demethylpuromycin-O-methyltransferase [Proteus hauseri ATCC 700826]
MNNNTFDLKNKAAAIDLMKKTMLFAIPAALRAAAKLKIADLLKDGPKSVNELAKETNSLPLALNRILRILASENIFYESEGLTYSLAPAGHFLLSDHEYTLRDSILMLTNETFWRPVGDVVESVQGNPAFENLYGMSFYEYWQDNVREDHDFQVGMNSLSKIENYFIVKHYDFPKNKVVTDIAGGLGGLLLEVLRVNPTLKGQLFDRKHVLERTRLTELGDDSRWKLIEGDLFGDYPESDIYLIKYIIHDWDDNSAVTFFKNFRKAMKPDSKVLIIEPVIFKKNIPDTAKYMDILCMSAFPESGERTVDEFNNLLDQADLKINKIIKTDTYHAILEVVIK